MAQIHFAAPPHDFKRRLPYFLIGGLVLAVTGVLDANRVILHSTGEYIQSLTWLSLYALVVSEFRRLDFRSKYLRWGFNWFSIWILAQLLLELPFVEANLDATLVKSLQAVTTAGWTSACALLLHGLLLNIKDLAKESQAKEKALRLVEESEHRWRSMFDVAEDSVFYKDLSLRYVHINQSMERLFEKPREAVLGSDDNHLFDRETAAQTQQEDLLVLQGETVDVVATKPVQGKPLTFHTIKVPVRDYAGDVIGLFGIARDITAPREAAERLELTQFSLDWAVDSILWIDKDGMITYANKAARSLLGDSVQAQSVHKIDQNWERSQSQRSLDGGCTYETEFITPTGEVPMEVSAIHFSGPGMGHTCVCARDISERKRLQVENQQRLTELSHFSRIQLAGEMVTGVAHELNQPLESISNYSYVMAKVLSPNRETDSLSDESIAQLHGRAQVICEQSLRAGNIIHRLRKLVKKRPPTRTRTDLNQLVRETLNLFGSQWSDTLNPVTSRLHPEPLMATVDEIQIQQVLLNLLTNARDAVHDRGDAAKIVIETTERTGANEFVISVEDNGIGFSEFDKEKLFAPFISTKREGMGLGLAISRSIAQSHGGDLSADHAPAGGAIIRLHLPNSVTEPKENELQSLRCG